METSSEDSEEITALNPEFSSPVVIIFCFSLK